MGKLRLFYCVVLSFIFICAFSYIVSADEILELNYNSIVVDLGYKDEQNVYSANLSDYIETVPSGLSLSELNFWVEDSSIADFLENDYLGTVTIIGENYGVTNLYVSNDNFSDIIPIYVVYPRSGSEPDYSPISWNFPEATRINRNCYSYALDLLEPVDALDSVEGFSYFIAPGEIAGALTNVLTDKYINCSDEKLASFMEYARMDVLALNNTLDSNKVFKCLDINDSYREHFEGILGVSDPNKFDFACAPGTYKVVLGRDETGGFHWLRQDSNGLWSHKLGWDYVTNVGNDNQLMFNPFICDGDGVVSGYLYIGCFQVPVWR